MRKDDLKFDRSDYYASMVCIALMLGRGCVVVALCDVGRLLRRSITRVS
jgi:hypothetical protein